MLSQNLSSRPFDSEPIAITITPRQLILNILFSELNILRRSSIWSVFLLMTAYLFFVDVSFLTLSLYRFQILCCFEWTGVFREYALGRWLEKRKIEKTSREPNHRSGCYRAVSCCLCLNHYTCTQPTHSFVGGLGCLKVVTAINNEEFIIYIYFKIVVKAT